MLSQRRNDLRFWKKLYLFEGLPCKSFLMSHIAFQGLHLTYQQGLRLQPPATKPIDRQSTHNRFIISPKICISYKSKIFTDIIIAPEIQYQKLYRLGCLTMSRIVFRSRSDNPSNAAFHVLPYS